MTNRRSKRVTQTTRQPWQWCHISGQLWRERRWLWTCWVYQKLAHNIGHNAGPCRTHHWDGNNVRGLGRGYQRQCPTNGAICPHQRYQNFGSRWCQDSPDQKPPKKWHRFASRLPAILVAITPGRHLGRPIRASATPPCWGLIHRPPSACRRPPGCLPTRIWLHNLWGLPGLGAPKSWKPSGWRNHRGW